MADAVCGPSNALQQFKQQTQHDRTLQQDRLINRHSPAQGFRSVNPNAGLLDPEFEAFQAGVPVPELPQLHHGLPQLQQQQHFQGPSQTPAWAADFNRMSLSSPPPMQQSYAPASSTANWAQGFQAHVAQNAPRAQNSSPSPYAFQQRARYGMNGFQSNFAQPGFASPSAVQGKGKEPVNEQFDDAAFERAFDMAREDLMVDDIPAAQNMDDTQNTQMNTEEIVDLIDQTREAHAVNKLQQDKNETLQADDQIKNHLFGQFEEQQDTQQQPQEERREDDDALAATAQELLSKVENNHSDKFKNSQFLNLMRKLRDREVTVRGDKMVETTATASTSADAPLNAPLSNPPLFNNSEQRPAPLDTRPPDYGIPSHEQDHDMGRINPSDGSDVATLLSQPGLPGGEPDPIPVGVGDDIDSEFMSTSPYYQP